MLICDNINQALGVGEVKVPTPTPGLINFLTPLPAFENIPTPTGIFVVVSGYSPCNTKTYPMFFNLLHVQSLTSVDDCMTAALSFYF